MLKPNHALVARRQSFGTSYKYGASVLRCFQHQWARSRNAMEQNVHELSVVYATQDSQVFAAHTFRLGNSSQGNHEYSNGFPISVPQTSLLYIFSATLLSSSKPHPCRYG
jgi:hypothetical protein